MLYSLPSSFALFLWIVFPAILFLILVSGLSTTCSSYLIYIKSPLPSESVNQLRTALPHRNMHSTPASSFGLIRQVHPLSYDGSSIAMPLIYPNLLGIRSFIPFGLCRVFGLFRPRFVFCSYLNYEKIINDAHFGMMAVRCTPILFAKLDCPWWFCWAFQCLKWGSWQLAGWYDRLWRMYTLPSLHGLHWLPDGRRIFDHSCWRERFWSYMLGRCILALRRSLFLCNIWQSMSWGTLRYPK